MTRDVSVVGPLNIDLLVRGDGPLNWEAVPTWDGPADMELAAAGSVGYTVQNLARLGLSVAVASCLPGDPLGGFIQATLERAGVDTALVQTVPNTLGGIGVYFLLFGSRKRPLAYRLPTHPLWPATFETHTVDALLDARVFHNGGYLHHRDAWHGQLVDVYRQARGRGLMTTLDPQFPLFALDPPWMSALEDVLPYVDVLFCDEHEARSLTAQPDLRTAAKLLLEAGAGLVVIKQGADGSTAYRAGWEQHQPAFVLGPLVDSIGAGDTYDAGFIYGMLQGWPVEERMRFASLAAGYSVTGVGGTQALPPLDVLIEDMQRRNPA